MNYTVYKHTFPNGKVYIGITNQTVERRWRNGRGYNTQELVYNAILKYGWDNIKHEILFTGFSKEEAERKEIELITTYKSNKRENGYNVNNGGCHQGCHSQETIEKIRKSKIGSHHTEQAKKKIAQASRGRFHSTETKMKRSKAVLCVELGEVFWGIREAERQISTCNGGISKCLSGQRKTAGGYHWEYYDNN